MSDTKQDILVVIPDEDLPELAAMYEKHKNWAPHVYSTIMTGIEWRRKRQEKYQLFVSPNNCWREDGTFFVFLMYHAFDLFIFSLDDTGKNIYEGIFKTTRIDCRDYKDRVPLIYSLNDIFFPIVRKALLDKGMSLEKPYTTYMFSIPREEALKFNVSCPSGMSIKELNSSHASLVNSLWPHRYKNSEKYVELLIDMNKAYGLFLESTGELVSWMLLSMMGQLAILHTLDDYRNKGYGTVITKYVSKILAQKGHNAIATVVDTNFSSISMFKKIGFNKSLGTVLFCCFK